MRLIPLEIMQQSVRVVPDDPQRQYSAMLQSGGYDAREWLAGQLQRTISMTDDLPDDPADLAQWSVDHAARVAAEHARYLAQRREGAPRRFFANRAQALWFLQQVAPTKEVDGAWLHGTLKHWQDPRFHGLIRTFLEELGDGDPRCNHVLIYQRLLSRLGCDQGLPLDPSRYLQGAVQLALGRNVEQYLPEVIGYNLGYEQPPLHLLITTHELAELGIDAHYFQLHVTIDNAASGHARRALQSLFLLMPGPSEKACYERVRRGYRLNDLGLDTASLIASFDLETELLAALQRKRVYGQFMHSDRCRLQGRTINQWLADASALPGFLRALETQQWVQRGEAPSNSRFWALIDGPHAAMFGVFTAYEKQLWHDWIAGDRAGVPYRRVAPGHWEQGLALEEGGPATQGLPRVECMIERMSGNHHAEPDGLRATRDFILATGLTHAGEC
ncbi:MULTISPECIES: iron-containing redox enzyme family protein [Pseudomonas]|uniref:iron-containing redox enzyme family protein n=2 Tax=Pseudomonas TaxID=286 RepID=UPI000410AB48|nr:iron-containing redox enzyme family protein [Pseudomonas taiwanensis]MDT8921296.1 iron-containing redox enzyme family protein [Pseudomonas taiwanensis]